MSLDQHVGSTEWISKHLRHKQKAQTSPEDFNFVLVSGTCVETGKPYTTAPIPAEGLSLWLMGRNHIQTLLPHVSADDREFIMSGYSPEGWDLAFGAEDS